LRKAFRFEECGGIGGKREEGREKREEGSGKRGEGVLPIQERRRLDLAGVFSKLLLLPLPASRFPLPA